jgi:hypothetical protein
MGSLDEGISLLPVLGKIHSGILAGRLRDWLLIMRECLLSSRIY